ncbi:MAG: type VI secretion system-associated FHA domain protein TagH, partial [Thalassolituus sp.]
PAPAPDAYTPPVPEPQIPPPPVEPAPAPAAPVASSASVTDLKALASQLGVPNLSDDQLTALLPEVSGIVNEAVTRLIDLLRARTAIKNELRVQHTMIQTVDNNPLKFSANAADALKMMFANDASAFMKPQEAIRDSFDDLSDHQVAVLKGMHAAYESMLRHFDPENLKRYINARDSLLGNKDAKHWVGFEQYYKSLKGDYETTYNQLFGEEFARAYEKQLAELKNARALNRQ